MGKTRANYSLLVQKEVLQMEVLEKPFLPAVTPTSQGCLTVYS